MNPEISITILLIAANVLFSFAGFGSAFIINNFAFWPYQVSRKFQLHRFITSSFLHADVVHLFFNMFTLFFFGKNLEYILNYYGLGGTQIYLMIYFSAMVVADLPGLMKYSNNYGYRSIGASGAVSAVVFATILFSPWQSIYLYGAVKISAALYAVLFIAYCMYMGKKGRDNINHDAHLWGAVYGLLLTAGIVYFKRPDLFQSILTELSHPSLFGKG